MSARRETMMDVKNIHDITNNLQNFLNININKVTEKDIDKIFNLRLPTKQINNLVKITKHSNENLEKLKSTLIKNRNLIAEEISCLNEVFDNTASSTSYEDISDDSNDRGEEWSTENSRNGSPAGSVDNNAEINMSKLKDIEEDEEGETEMQDELSETRKLLEQAKKNRIEDLGPPPSFDMSKLK